MNRSTTWVMASVLALTGWLAPMASAENAKDENGQAIMCPKCETVWVKTPRQTGGKRGITYVSKKKMVCEDCKSAAASFFSGGKFEHTCKTCGDLIHCDEHPEPTSGPAPKQSTFVPGKDGAIQHHTIHPDPTK
ncbi:MAG TPA: hypothetical protein PJ991_05895 [Kiritimatiellia bacterium]|nr:hypothetical protein [Kiritimatiellia bacterium]